MKVLVDNYKKNECVVTNPNKLVCEHCESELEYDSDDVHVGEYGCSFISCPLCGYANYLWDGKHDLILTKHNIEFPTHFHHTSVNTGAVDCCDNKDIKECICKAIDYFRKNKDEYYWFTAYGNLYVIVFRLEGDENYDVVVTKDYYETAIPFEQVDY